MKSSWPIGGILHTCFEGYFVLNYATLASKQDLFGQLWKEYALSDSRYLTGDTFVLCAEVVTVCAWGPLSILTAGSIMRSSPWRHPLQLIVCLAHMYGDVLYLSTALVDWYMRDIAHTRPEAYYFGFYLLFLNGIWIFVPAGRFDLLRPHVVFLC